MQKNKVLIFCFIFILFFDQPSYADHNNGNNFPNNVKNLIYSKKFNFKEKRKIQSNWDKLCKRGYIKLKGTDFYLRQRMNPLVSLVELGIIEGLKNHFIKNAVLVIHNPYPPTSLRIQDNTFPPGMIPKAYSNIKNLTDNILFRHQMMIKILDLNATVISAYLDSYPKSKIPGYQNYLTLTNKYKNLINKPLKKLPQEYVGGTFLIEDQNGEILVFAFSGVQLNAQLVSDRSWEMWFGKLNSKNVSKRVVKIDSFLKNQEIDLYQYLHHKIEKY